MWSEGLGEYAYERAPKHYFGATGRQVWTGFRRGIPQRVSAVRTDCCSNIPPFVDVVKGARAPAHSPLVQSISVMTSSKGLQTVIFWWRIVACYIVRMIESCAVDSCREVAISLLSARWIQFSEEVEDDSQKAARSLMRYTAQLILGGFNACALPTVSCIRVEISQKSNIVHVRS